MAKGKKKQKQETSLVAIQPTEVEVLPPENGVVGEFLHNVRNTIKISSRFIHGVLSAPPFLSSGGLMSKTNTVAVRR